MVQTPISLQSKERIRCWSDLVIPSCKIDAVDAISCYLMSMSFWMFAIFQEWSMYTDIAFKLFGGVTQPSPQAGGSMNFWAAFGSCVTCTPGDLPETFTQSRVGTPNSKSLTSSTAQGGGGSFKNRKPIGEVGCCESGMAQRSHWLTERWLELCLLEWLQWLQWSPHPQLLDVVWCTATVVVVVA